MGYFAIAALSSPNQALMWNTFESDTVAMQPSSLDVLGLGLPVTTPHLTRILSSGRRCQECTFMALSVFQHGYFADQTYLRLFAAGVLQSLRGRTGDQISSSLVRCRYDLPGAWPPSSCLLTGRRSGTVSYRFTLLKQ